MLYTSNCRIGVIRAYCVTHIDIFAQPIADVNYYFSLPVIFPMALISTVIRFPKDLHAQIKRKASEEESSMQAIVIHAVQSSLNAGIEAPAVLNHQTESAAKRSFDKFVKLRSLNTDASAAIDKILSSLLDAEETKQAIASPEAKTKAEQIAAWLAAPQTETDRHFAEMLEKMLQV